MAPPCRLVRQGAEIGAKGRLSDPISRPRDSRSRGTAPSCEWLKEQDWRLKICFISNYNVGFGLSGGDRIFIELMKGWRQHAQIVLLGCEEAILISRRYGIENVHTLPTLSLIHI